MAKKIAAQIGDDALAEGRHEIVARARGEGERRDNGDQLAEARVDATGAVLRKTVVDHPAHGDGERQCGARGR